MRGLLEELERLATRLGVFSELVERSRGGLKSTYDVTSCRCGSSNRIARVYDERLGDPRAAIEAYRRILGVDEENARRSSRSRPCTR